MEEENVSRLESGFRGSTVQKEGVRGTGLEMEGSARAQKLQRNLILLSHFLVGVHLG